MGAYIGAGEPPARPTGGMPLHTVGAPHLPPVGRAGCPRGRVRGLFTNKKSFLFPKRLSGGV
jgi:hypothetical protein